MNLDTKDIIMELFAKKGTINLLFVLHENEGEPYSKYQLERKANLSFQTLEERLEALIKKNLVKETLEVGPRSRTEIELTDLGRRIVKLLLKIRDELEKG